MIPHQIRALVYGDVIPDERIDIAMASKIEEFNDLLTAAEWDVIPEAEALANTMADFLWQADELADRLRMSHDTYLRNEVLPEVCDIARRVDAWMRRMTN